MSVDYDFSRNLHTVNGPKAALPLLFPGAKPKNILDVGCGIGTWLKAALEFGIGDVFGVDGVDSPADQLLIPKEFFRQQDFTKPWRLDRRFEAAICLEVAEHLDAPVASQLIDTLVHHSDAIYFSAACPRQPGQHHVNCQWPAYWQGLFNERGYVCDDALRWQIWDDKRIEAWYRQNIFVATKNPGLAGRENRIKPVVHPEIVPYMECQARQDGVASAKSGHMPVAWYLEAPVSAFFGKLGRVVRRAAGKENGNGSK